MAKHSQGTPSIVQRLANPAGDTQCPADPGGPRDSVSKHVARRGGGGNINTQPLNCFAHRKKKVNSIKLASRGPIINGSTSIPGAHARRRENHNISASPLGNRRSNDIFLSSSKETPLPFGEGYLPPLLPVFPKHPVALGPRFEETVPRVPLLPPPPHPSSQHSLLGGLPAPGSRCPGPRRLGSHHRQSRALLPPWSLAKFFQQ